MQREKAAEHKMAKASYGFPLLSVKGHAEAHRGRAHSGAAEVEVAKLGHRKIQKAFLPKARRRAAREDLWERHGARPGVGRGGMLRPRAKRRPEKRGKRPGVPQE